MSSEGSAVVAGGFPTLRLNSVWKAPVAAVPVKPPGVLLAVIAGVVARPWALVVVVNESGVPPPKLPEGPMEGMVNVTLALATGLLLMSKTRATNGLPNGAAGAAVCPEPETTEIPAAGGTTIGRVKGAGNAPLAAVYTKVPAVA